MADALAAHLDAPDIAPELLVRFEVAVLTELGGFPGVSWDNVSADLQAKFKDIVPTSIPVFPSGDWEKAVNDGWYRNVAPNIDRTAK